MWEHKDFVYKWPPRKGGWVHLGSYTTPAARLHFWQENQAAINKKLHEWFDKGWEPLGEVGPGAIQLRYYKSLTQGSDAIELVLEFWLCVVTLGLAYFSLRNTFVEPSEFRVAMRRRKSS